MKVPFSFILNFFPFSFIFNLYLSCFNSMLRSLENVNFKLDINNYEIKDLIGTSGFSNVFKAVDKKTGKVYAFKFTSLLDDYVSHSNFALDIMRICNFPTVLKNYGYFYFKKNTDIPDYLREKFICYRYQDFNF